MNKVLIVTYYWPPSGGAGVQRWLKFAKYLPEYGYEPVVLTVDPIYATYPSKDHTLEKEVSEGITVIKTRSIDWFRFYKKSKDDIPSAGFAKNNDNSLKGKISRFIRGNFFIPDPRRGWNRYAYKKGCELLSKNQFHAVITSSPPHSSQLIGLKLKKKFPSVKWIADLRDAWTDIYYYDMFYPTFLSRTIDLRYEKKVFLGADKIITVAETQKQSLATRFPDTVNKITVITNGYDEDDFNTGAISSSAELIIGYIGTISPAYPMEGFIKALQELNSENFSFTLKMAGEFSADLKEILVNELPAGKVQISGYLSHAEAVKMMQESSVLLLIIPENSSNKSIIPGKLFEYLATGKPVLCLGPEDGDVALILKDTGRGITTEYMNKSAIKSFLKNPASYLSAGSDKAVEKYSRRSLTEQLSSLLK